MNLFQPMKGPMLSKFLQVITNLTVSVVTLVLLYDKEYRVIGLLPISYLVINSIRSSVFIRGEKYNGGFLYAVAQVVIFVRYMITPFTIALSGAFYARRIPTSVGSINLAVALMIYELISIYVTHFVARKYYTKRFGTAVETSATAVKNKFVLWVFLLTSLPVLLLTDTSLVFPTDFFVLGDTYMNPQLEVSNEGLFFSLAMLVKPVMFLLAFSYIKEKHDRHGGSASIWLSFVLVAVFMGMHTGTKRWGIRFTAIIGIYLIRVSYDKLPKHLLVGIVSLMCVSFLSASLYKFAWIVQGSSRPFRDIIVAMLEMFQDYFSGPRAVANSLDMLRAYGSSIGLSTLVNDYAGSIPVVSRYIDQMDRINVYFNLYHNLDKTSLIMPMVGIGYAYFPVFPPVFTVLHQWLLIRMDYRLETSRSIEFRYLYLHIGLYLAMCIGFNTQIIFARLLIPFLPLLVLFNLNRKISFRKRFRLHNI